MNYINYCITSNSDQKFEVNKQTRQRRKIIYNTIRKIPSNLRKNSKKVVVYIYKIPETLRKTRTKVIIYIYKISATLRKSTRNALASITVIYYVVQTALGGQTSDVKVFEYHTSMNHSRVSTEMVVQASIILDDLANLNDSYCILDGVNGFQPSRPMSKHGLPKVNRYKPATPTGLPKPNPIPHARVTHKLKSNEDNSCSPNSNRGKELVNERFNKFSDKMTEKYPGFKLDKKRFSDLCYDPQTKKINRDTIYEAEGALELEARGLVTNIRRPDNPNITLDFQGEGQGAFSKYRFFESKRPISQETLKSRNAKPGSQQKVGFNIGENSVKQQTKVVNKFEGAPKSANETLVFVQLDDMSTLAEKNLMVDSILNGVEANNGDPSTFYFLNIDE